MNKPIPVSLGKLSIAAIAAIAAFLILWNGTGEAQDPSPTVAVSNAGKKSRRRAHSGRQHLVRTVVLHGSNLHHARASQHLCI